MKTHPLLTLTIIAFGLAATSSSGFAQGESPRTEIVASFSFTGKGEVDSARLEGQNGLETRTLLTSATRTFYVHNTRCSVGISELLVRVNADADLPLPVDLYGVTLDLAGEWKISDQWSLNARAQPGFYGDADLEIFGQKNADLSDTFQIGGVVAGIWEWTSTWKLTAGARYNPFLEDPLLPVMAVRWQPRDVWIILLGFPRTEAAYSMDARTSVFAAASYETAAFAVSDADISSWSRSVADGETKLEFREVRVEGGARWRVGKYLRIQVGAGVALARRWSFYNRHVEFRPEPAVCGNITVACKF